MSPEDRELMNSIREDLMSVSEFGDPCYYEELEELEEEERRKEALYEQEQRLRRRHSDDSESHESIQSINRSNVNRSHQEAIEMIRKNKSEIYRNEHLEEILYGSSRKQNNAETSTQKTTEAKPLGKEKKDPEKIQGEVKVNEIKKERVDRKKRNAMLIALEQRKKLSSNDSTSSNQELARAKNFSTIDENHQKNEVVKALPQKSEESLDVTERFRDLLTQKEVEENEDDLKDSESSCSYYTASSGSGDSSASKPKKQNHSTSQRRRNFKSLTYDPSTSTKPFRYVPPKSKGSLNLKSKSDFPDL